MWRKTGFLVAAAAVIALPAWADAQEDVGAVASIKPVHSLVAGVMQGAGTPYLIVKGGGSPHAYSLKPSDARALEGARVVFWVGEELEKFLSKSIATLATRAKVVELIGTHGLTRLPFREGGPFEAHDDEDEQKKEASHDEKNGREEKLGDKEEKHGHEAEEKHGDDADAHGETETHVWLDPVNAKALVQEIEEALSEADPANAARYKANAEALEKRLDSLDAEIAATLAPVRNRPFIVFHDGYQYFEKRYGLKAAGSITVSPEQLPGARRITEIRAKVKTLGATCVFAEPQFEPKLIGVVTEGTAARAGVLDPLGSDLPDGPDLYFTLMRNMANAMKDCLSPGS